MYVCIVHDRLIIAVVSAALSFVSATTWAVVVFHFHVMFGIATTAESCVVAARGTGRERAPTDRAARGRAVIACGIALRRPLGAVRHVRLSAVTPAGRFSRRARFSRRWQCGGRSTRDDCRRVLISVRTKAAAVEAASPAASGA